MRLTTLTLTATLISGFFIPAAQADIINYTFTVTATSGPLSGASSVGTFSFDAVSVHPGGSNKTDGLFTALNFTWDGISYDNSTANTGVLTFDTTSILIGVLFGSLCSGTPCGVSPGTESWLLDASGFNYSLPASESVWSGTAKVAPAIASAPEPSGTFLALGGVLLLCLADRGANSRRSSSAATLLAAFLFAPAAQAAIVDYTFTVTAPTGPLAGTSSIGTFSFDPASLVMPGASSPDHRFTTFDFTWDGIHYDRTGVYFVGFSLDGAGALNRPFFGTDCCEVSGGIDNWYVDGSSSTFTYGIPSAPSLFFGTVVSAPTSAPAPEPASFVLAITAAILLFALSKTRFGFLLTLPVALITMGTLSPPGAKASILTYNFSVEASSGPLAGASAVGTFSFDSASITPGSTNTGMATLTALHFNCNGIDYNQTTANTGSMTFDASGTLVDILFGTRCFSGICTLLSGSAGWLIGASALDYYVASSAVLGGGTSTFGPAATSAPEPSSMALTILGAIALFYRASRPGG